MRVRFVSLYRVNVYAADSFHRPRRIFSAVILHELVALANLHLVQIFPYQGRRIFLFADEKDVSLLGYDKAVEAVDGVLSAADVSVCGLLMSL